MIGAGTGDHAGDHLRVFVYGTLRRGDVRWPILERFVTGAESTDRVPGRLFDTGLGYPAAVFDEPDGRTGSMIVGSVYTLASDSVDEALAVLDEVEGTVAGLYHRVTVVTEGGLAAWAYAYGDGLPLSPIESGDWFAPS